VDNFILKVKSTLRIIMNLRDKLLSSGRQTNTMHFVEFDDLPYSQAVMLTFNYISKSNKISIYFITYSSVHFTRIY